MTTEPARKTLAEHIGDSIEALCRRLLAELADDDHGRAVRERLAAWCETAHERVTVELEADQTRRGRPDPRSVRAVVRYHAAPGGMRLGELDVDPVVPVVGSVVLCAPLLRHLVDGRGRRIDSRTTYHELRHQDAEAWPDTVPEQWPAPPPHPGMDRAACDRLLEQWAADGWPDGWGRDSLTDRLNGDDRG